MKQNYHLTLLVSLILIAGLLAGCTIGYAHPQEFQTSYLPLISGPPEPTPIFGVEVSSLSNDKVLSAAQNAHTYWLRLNGLLWYDVQPNSPDEWFWDSSSVASMEQNLLRAYNHGMKVVLIIRGTPVWAQAYDGYSCGPVIPEKLPALANFMKEVVKRYSVPPFNVDYYEIWNEPDVDHTLVPPDSQFGCWGDKTDAYYGGSGYAAMLEQIYPAMKSANPQVQIVIGGLLLDCDPTHIGSEGCTTDEAARAPRFIEGVLMSGGANYFDVISFHGYPYYGTNYPVPIQAELNYPKWKALGGIIQGKITYLRQLMANYGIDKPIIHTEVALLQSGNITSSGQLNPHVDSLFEEAKADYLVWLYARSASQHILGTLWYTLNGPGWKSGGLLDGNQDPLPAYQAYQFMRHELWGTTYAMQIGNPLVDNIIEFIFAGENKDIHLYIPTDGNSHAIAAPVGWLAVYDVYGNPVDIPGDTITLLHPVYVELGH